MKRITVEGMHKNYLKRVEERFCSLTKSIQKLGFNKSHNGAEEVLSKINLKLLINKGHAQAVKRAKGLSNMEGPPGYKYVFGQAESNLFLVYKLCKDINLAVERVGPTNVAKAIREYVNTSELDLFLVQLGDLSNILEEIK